MINKTLGVNLQYSSKPPSKKFDYFFCRPYFLININEAGPCTGSSLVFNHKPAVFSIYSRNSGPQTSSLILMRQIHGQEVHWYLILNQFFFEIYNILVLGIWNIRSQEDTQ